MRYPWIFLVGLASLGCASLPTTGDGVVALELLVPKALIIAPGDSLQLRARAVDRNGDTVAAAIRWHTVDTLVIRVDSLRGMVTPLLTTGSGRVQAAVGTLRSDPITITIRAPSP